LGFQEEESILQRLMFPTKIDLGEAQIEQILMKKAYDEFMLNLFRNNPAILEQLMGGQANQQVDPAAAQEIFNMQQGR
jgi:hypothetical protein